jgi:mono/diheme cytochrome c family protein
LARPYWPAPYLVYVPNVGLVPPYRSAYPYTFLGPPYPYPIDPYLSNYYPDFYPYGPYPLVYPPSGVVATPLPDSSQTPFAGSLDGKETFHQFCATCHGDRGKGNGPASGAMKTRPADLTTIAKRKGAFSAPNVEAAIRGNNDIAAHGSAAMPVWGQFFSAVDRTDAEARTRIANLVKYLESIQAK